MNDQTEFLERESKQQAALERVKSAIGVEVKNDWVDAKEFV
jgi:hypothetical protein